MLINHWRQIWEFHKGPIFSEMAHLFQTQWAICPNGFDIWAEPCRLVQQVSPPPHGGHVLRWIKISQTSFEKGHPRNNPVKLFPNRTRGFREEDFFLRISSCRYSAKSLPPWQPCFSTDHAHIGSFRPFFHFELRAGRDTQPLNILSYVHFKDNASFFFILKPFTIYSTFY